MFFVAAERSLKDQWPAGSSHTVLAPWLLLLDSTALALQGLPLAVPAYDPLAQVI